MNTGNLKLENSKLPILDFRYSLFIFRTFFTKTKQLRLMKTIKLFILVHKIKKENKKSGNNSYGLYNMFDTTTGN